MEAPGPPADRLALRRDGRSAQVRRTQQATQVTRCDSPASWPEREEVQGPVDLYEAGDSMRIIAEHLGFGVSTISRALTKQCRHHSSEVGMKLRSKASGIEAETAQLAERLPCPMAP